MNAINTNPALCGTPPHPRRGVLLICLCVLLAVVNQRGIVYEKDLGPNSPAIASSMIAFHKDGTWRATEE